jgi:3-oxoacyl-[acyl-carrier-protein] synthase II
MKLKRVVVTGMGAVTPIGNTVPELWESLLNGVSGANIITKFDASKFKSRFACEVKNFDAEVYMDRKEARKIDLFSQYAIATADQAIKDSGIDLEKINLDRAGVIYASGIGGLITFFDEVTAFNSGDGTPRFNPFFIPKMISDIASGHISIKYGLRGPNFSITSACASSSNSLVDAFNYIRFGKADMFVTGGSEAAVNQAGIGGFNAMHALSVRNDDFATGSRPFDKDRDGFVLGEGSGTVIFEELEHALNRGARIYAEVVGGGLTADAYHITSPHPEGLGAYNVMRLAIEDGGLNIDDIDYINAHGTSTPLGDIAESKAIVKLFGEHAYKLNISSSKSMTGHLLGAAGAVEAITSILAVYNDIIPPTINHFTDDPEIDNKLNFTFHKSQKRTVRAALSNTFGFGGHNASIVFKKFDAK